MIKNMYLKTQENVWAIKWNCHQLPELNSADCVFAMELRLIPTHVVKVSLPNKVCNKFKFVNLSLDITDVNQRGDDTTISLSTKALFAKKRCEDVYEFAELYSCKIMIHFMFNIKKMYKTFVVVFFYTQHRVRWADEDSLFQCNFVTASLQKLHTWMLSLSHMYSTHPFYTNPPLKKE